MAWLIEITRSAIESLDRKAQVDVLKFLQVRVASVADPRQTGKALKGDLGDLWRYRVGDYRIICDIRDTVVTVLVLRVRHRKEAYRR